MSYFQEIVTEYLRANRATFVNTECLIQLDPNDLTTKGTSWYCDVLAVDFSEPAVLLCEVTYSKTLHSLLKRLQAWDTHWPDLCSAIARDSHVPREWSFQPWVFIPEDLHMTLMQRLPRYIRMEQPAGAMPKPRITHLESVTPWKYPNWDRKTVALEE
jgi:hypothetical protein